MLNRIRLDPPPSPNRRKYPFVASIDYQGIPIHVENEAGSVRHGKGRDGESWSTYMHHHYGEIVGARGNDGDRIDVYVRQDAPGTSERVFVVHQVDPATGRYDEDKVMLGWDDPEAALDAYVKQYNAPGYAGGLDEIPIDELRAWALGRARSSIITAKRPIPGAHPEVLLMRGSTGGVSKLRTLVRARVRGHFRGGRPVRAYVRHDIAASPHVSLGAVPSGRGGATPEDDQKPVIAIPDHLLAESEEQENVGDERETTVAEEAGPGGKFGFRSVEGSPENVEQFYAELHAVEDILRVDGSGISVKILAEQAQAQLSAGRHEVLGLYRPRTRAIEVGFNPHEANRGALTAFIHEYFHAYDHAQGRGSKYASQIRPAWIDAVDKTPAIRAMRRRFRLFVMNNPSAQWQKRVFKLDARHEVLARLVEQYVAAKSVERGHDSPLVSSQSTYASMVRVGLYATPEELAQIGPVLRRIIGEDVLKSFVALASPAGTWNAEAVDHDGTRFGVVVEFDSVLAKSLGYGEQSATGERWITMHPHGRDEEHGVRVLIRESRSEPGTYHVVGGAGGRLNYLRLKNVKSVEHAKRESRERYKERRKVARERDKERRARMMAQGMTAKQIRELEGTKKEKTDEEKMRRVAAERALIEKVARTQGWTPEQLEYTPPEGAPTPTANQQKRAQDKFHRDLYMRAKRVVEGIKKRLVIDHEARKEAELGTIPLEAGEGDGVGFSDLVKDQPGKGLGYAKETKQRVEEAIPEVEEVGTMDAEGLRNRVRELEPAIREAAGSAVGGPRAEKRGAEKVAELTGQVEKLIADGDVAGAREKVKELTVRYEVVHPEKHEVTQRRREEMMPEEFIASQTAEENLKEAAANKARDRRAGIYKAPDVPIQPRDFRDAVEIIAADKAVKGIQRESRQREKAIKEGVDIEGVIKHEKAPRGAYMIENRDFGEAVQEVERDIEDELRSRAARALLERVEEVSHGLAAKAGAEDPGEEARRHLERSLGIGVVKALDDVSMAFTRTPVVSRDVVDVLGAAGAAQLLAWHAKSNATPQDVEHLRAAVGEWHRKRQREVVDEALRTADEHTRTAEEINLGAAETAHDVQELYELNERRKEFIAQARDSLGTALGELEAAAALHKALGESQPEEIHVSLGALAVPSAITQIRALGLEPDDYELHNDGKNTFATIRESAFHKLAHPPDPDEVAHAEAMSAIKRGERDEPGWQPPGFAKRPPVESTHNELTHHPAWLAEDLHVHPDMDADAVRRSVRDFIGQRVADGQSAGDIYRELHSPNGIGRAKAAGKADEYLDALAELAPQHKAFTVDVAAARKRFPQAFEGKPETEHDAIAERVLRAANTITADELDETFRGHSREYMRDRFGDDARADFHAQTVDGSDPKVREAVHRALADHPAAVLAFKEPGDITPQDQHVLRRYFEENFAKREAGREERAAEAKDQLRRLGPEPPKVVPGLFGEQPNAAHTEWAAKKAELEAAAAGTAVAEGDLTWSKYVGIHGTPQRAYEALQDTIKSGFLGRFAEEHAALTGRALKVGKTVLRNNVRHLDAVDPEARERRLEEQRKLTDSLRSRIAGQYASGEIRDKLDLARKRERIMDENNLSLFAAEPGTGKVAPTLRRDERVALGQTAENQIHAIVGSVARNDPRHKYAVAHADMSTGDRIHQQRAIKAHEVAHNLGVFYGVGSGKTNVGFGSYTNLHNRGEVRRGLFAVPSSVQAQFGSEALKFLEPGKYGWHAVPGASYEERLAAYRDPGKHMVVVTHQSLRDDVVRMVADDLGVEEKEAARRLETMPEAERNDAVEGAFKSHGADALLDYLFMDEAHAALNRAGKPDSLLAGIVDSMAHVARRNGKYTAFATGTEVKNDASEVYDWLRKLAPEKFGDRGAFMRKYGVDTTATKDALRRLVSSYFVHADIKPDVKANFHEHSVPLSPEQQTQHDAAVEASQRVRAAIARGEVDVDAARALSPTSFDGKPAGQHRAIAEKVHKSIGTARENALRKAIDEHDPRTNAKVRRLVEIANEMRTARNHDGAQGRPGVVFANSLAAIKHIEGALKAAGHRTVVLTGADMGEKRADKIRAHSPPNHADATADIIIMSSAGEAGINLQRGNWLVNYDTPMTFKSWQQRQGRVNRLGQVAPEVDVHDLVGEADYEVRARKRLRRKRDLHEIFHGDDGLIDDSGFALELARQRARQAHTEDEPSPEVAGAQPRRVSRVHHVPSRQGPREGLEPALRVGG